MIGKPVHPSAEFRRARRGAAMACLAAATLAIAACTDHIASPGAALRTTLAIRPRFAQVPGVPITLGKIEARLIGPNGDTTKASSSFANGEARLSLAAPIDTDGTPFTLELVAFDQKGTPAYHSRGDYILQIGENEDLYPSLERFGMVVINDFNLLTDGYVSDELPTGNAMLVRNLANFPTVGARSTSRDLLLFYGHNSACFNPGDRECPPEALTQFVSALKAVNVSVQVISDAYNDTTQVSTIARLDSIPKKIRTVMLMTPTIAFSNAEVNVLKRFIGDGGRVVHIGEWFGFQGTTIVEVQNALLAAMGAAARNPGAQLGSGEYACGYTPLTGDNLFTHQIMDSVTEVDFGCGSELTLGAADLPLFQVNVEGSNRILAADVAVDLTPLSTAGQNVIPGTSPRAMAPSPLDGRGRAIRP